jgi:hypothetical protein
MDNNDVIDLLVAAADPFPEAPGGMPLVNEALDNLGPGIASLPVVSARHRRRWIIAGAAAAAMLAVGGSAAADWVSARTGWFGDPGMTEDDGSEWLRLDWPEIPDIVVEQVRQLDLAVPEGVAPGDIVGDVVARFATTDDPTPALIQETGLRNAVGWDIACHWGWIWLEANGTDPETAAKARTGMTEAASRTDALADALDRDDGALAQSIRANCTMPQADR